MLFHQTKEPPPEDGLSKLKEIVLKLVLGGFILGLEVIEELDKEARDEILQALLNDPTAEKTAVTYLATHGSLELFKQVSVVFSQARLQDSLLPGSTLHSTSHRKMLAIGLP